MKWIKSKNKQEVITLEGYRLKIELQKDNSFSWLVYKDNYLIYSSIKENRFSNNINKAKKIAVQRMLCHLKKLLKSV